MWLNTFRISSYVRLTLSCKNARTNRGRPLEYDWNNETDSESVFSRAVGFYPQCAHSFAFSCNTASKLPSNSTLQHNTTIGDSREQVPRNSATLPKRLQVREVHFHSLRAIMSGAEAFAVLGLISSIITIIETSKKIYDAARNEFGLHESFRKIAENLPIVLQTLRKVHQVQKMAARESSRTRDVDRKRAIANVSKAVEPIVSACEKIARALRRTFENCMPGVGASWPLRYFKAVCNVVPGRKRKVEQMFGDLLQKLQLLAQHQIFENAIASAEISTAMKKFHSRARQTSSRLELGSARNDAKTESEGQSLPAAGRLSSRALHEGGVRYDFTYNNSDDTKVASQGSQVIYGGQVINL